MFTYKKVRNFLLKRNIKLFKKEYNWDYSFFRSPYRKIKTILNLEIAAILIFLVSNTKVKANQITFFGVFWVYLATFFIATDIPTLVYLALIMYFTKLIPDYMDGTLAHLKNQQSKEGFELDLWAGDVNKLGILVGIILYIFNSSGEFIYLYVLILSIIFNVVDPRKHISRTKFGISVYKKNVQTHIQKIKKDQSFIFNFLKYLNFDGRSNYSDFMILLIILDIFLNFNSILFLMPWMWLILYFLSFSRANYQVFFKK